MRAQQVHDVRIAGLTAEYEARIGQNRVEYQEAYNAFYQVSYPAKEQLTKLNRDLEFEFSEAERELRQPLEAAYANCRAANAEAYTAAEQAKKEKQAALSLRRRAAELMRYGPLDEFAEQVVKETSAAHHLAADDMRCQLGAYADELRAGLAPLEAQVQKRCDLLRQELNRKKAANEAAYAAVVAETESRVVALDQAHKQLQADRDAALRNERDRFWQKSEQLAAIWLQFEKSVGSAVTELTAALAAESPLTDVE